MVGTQMGCSALTAYPYPIPFAVVPLHRPINLSDCRCSRKADDDVGLTFLLQHLKNSTRCAF